MITKEQQLRSKHLMDKFCLWALDSAGSGMHGDLVRLIAGGKTAASQNEYVKKYGTALPVPLLCSDDVAEVRKCHEM